MPDFSEIDRLATRVILDYQQRRNTEVQTLAEAVESDERLDATVEEFDSPPPRFFVIVNLQGQFLAGWVGGRPVWRGSVDAAEVFFADHPRMREALALPDATTLPAPWWQIKEDV